jgi:hypothetical protein
MLVSVPIQSVTIRTGDTNLSPEEIEQKKKISDAKEKADNNAEVENVRLAKLAEKEEREKLRKVVFLKTAAKRKWSKSQPASRTTPALKSRAGSSRAMK